MEEAERGEEEGEEEEEESPKELESEEEEIAIVARGLGWFLYYWLWEEGVCCGEEPIRVRLNSERWKTDRQFSRSTRSHLQRCCIFFGGCRVF